MVSLDPLVQSSSTRRKKPWPRGLLLELGKAQEDPPALHRANSNLLVVLSHTMKSFDLDQPPPLH